MVRFYIYLEVYLDDLQKKISLSEFEKHFKIPHQTMKKYLAGFVKAKILKEEKQARFLYYKLQLDNPLTKEYLLICEKERLLDFLEKNTLFSRLYSELARFFQDSKILLFGSCIRRADFSDIDMLIMSRNVRFLEHPKVPNKRKDFLISKNKSIKQALKKFEETYSIKIHTIQTSEKDLTKTFINEIRQKHIILNNHDYLMEVLYK